MGWRELQAWLGAMKRALEPRQVEPDSWAGVDQDPWWQEARRKRDAERNGH
jgi:hypothetical protein